MKIFKRRCSEGKALRGEVKWYEKNLSTAIRNKLGTIIDTFSKGLLAAEDKLSLHDEKCTQCQDATR